MKAIVRLGLIYAIIAMMKTYTITIEEIRQYWGDVEDETNKSRKRR